MGGAGSLHPNPSIQVGARTAKHDIREVANVPGAIFRRPQGILTLNSSNHQDIRPLCS